MQQFKLNLPSWLHGSLKLDASMNRRSLSSEIIYQLERRATLSYTDVAARILMRQAKKLRARNPTPGSRTMKKVQVYESLAHDIQLEMNKLRWCSKKYA